MKIYDDSCFDATAYTVDQIIGKTLDRKLWHSSDEDGMLQLNGNKLDHRTFVKTLWSIAFKWMVDDVINENATVLYRKDDHDYAKLTMHNINKKEYAGHKLKDMTNDRSVGAQLYPQYTITLVTNYMGWDRTIYVFVDKDRSEIIKKNTDEGMRYCNGKTDYDIRHYAERLHDEVAPEYNIRWLCCVLKAVLRQIDCAQFDGVDIYSPFDDGWAYFGKVIDFVHLTEAQVRSRIAHKIDVVLRYKGLAKPANMAFIPLRKQQYDMLVKQADELRSAGKHPIVKCWTYFHNTLLGAVVSLIRAQYVLCVFNDKIIHQDDSYMVDFDDEMKVYENVGPIDISFAMQIGRDIRFMDCDDIENEFYNKMLKHAEEKRA